MAPGSLSAGATSAGNGGTTQDLGVLVKAPVLTTVSSQPFTLQVRPRKAGNLAAHDVERGVMQQCLVQLVCQMSPRRSSDAQVGSRQPHASQASYTSEEPTKPS